MFLWWKYIHTCTKRKQHTTWCTWRHAAAGRFEGSPDHKQTHLSFALVSCDPIDNYVHCLVFLKESTLDTHVLKRTGGRKAVDHQGWFVTQSWTIFIGNINILHSSTLCFDFSSKKGISRKRVQALSFPIICYPLPRPNPPPNNCWAFNNNK